MFIAVEIQKSSAAKVQTGFGVALGIEFYELQFIPRDMRQKRDEMLLRHFVMNRYEIFILDLLDSNGVVFIIFLCFEWRQGDSVTTYDGISRRVNYIPAKRTNVES